MAKLTRYTIAAEFTAARQKGFDSGHRTRLDKYRPTYVPTSWLDPLAEHLYVIYAQGFKEGREALKSDLRSLREAEGSD